MQSRPTGLLASIFPYYGAIEKPAEDLEKIIERESESLAQDDPPRSVLFGGGAVFSGGLATMCVFATLKKDDDLVFLAVLASLGYLAMVALAIMAIVNYQKRNESKQRLEAAQTKTEELEPSLRV